MLNFALIGCGRISRKYVKLLGENQIQGAKLVAVCDLIDQRAQAYSDKYRVPSFTDMHQMMRNMGKSIDVICILTPSGSHADNCLQMVQYKKHIVVEKPMALTIQDADAMIEKCGTAGVTLFVVKQNRYNLPVVKLREVLESGRFGKIVLGTVRVRWSRNQAYYDQDPWRGTWAQDGGVFTNQASHHIDLLEWMLGEVESVYAKAMTALHNIEVEDTGAAVIKFKSGALGIVEATTCTRPKDLEGSISILGERGTVEIGGFAVNEMKVWDFVDRQEGDDDILKIYKQNPPDVYGFGHAKYLEHVVDCIENNKKPLVDGVEGRKSLELINAIYASVEAGHEIKMINAPKKCRLGIK